MKDTRGKLEILDCRSLHPCADNVPVLVTGTLFYRVSDSYKATFAVQDYIGAVRQLGTSAARAVIGKWTYDEINGDRVRLNLSLSQQIQAGGEPWGVSCTRFEIQNIAPENEHVKKQLEKQVAAERQRRENELNVRATVNTAQGERDAAILHAEGERSALIQRAEGQALADRLKADAAKYTFDTETEAKTRLIKDTVTAFGDSNLAATYLIEMARTQQLQALAHGPNNATYFLPSDLLSQLGTTMNHLATNPGIAAALANTASKANK